MAHYRAYFLGRDGHFIKAVDIICDDDEGAKQQALRMVDDSDIELWQKDRRVEKFESQAMPDRRIGNRMVHKNTSLCRRSNPGSAG
jgi:hypothetical protein